MKKILCMGTKKEKRFVYIIKEMCMNILKRITLAYIVSASVLLLLYSTSFLA